MKRFFTGSVIFLLGSIFTFAGVIPPTPTSVTGVAFATSNGTYNIGDNIDVTVTFDNAATVTGFPRIQFETGTTDQFATYLSGTGTLTLTFRYQVQAGDVAADLDYISTGSLTLNGGTIMNGVDNATLTLPAVGTLAAASAIVIDGVVPAAFTVGTVVTTGGTVVATFWNSTNTGVNITVPVANDASLTGGTIQLQERRNAGGFVNVANTVTSPYPIVIGNLGNNVTLSMTAAAFEGIPGFTNTDLIEITAIITDVAGNSTTGTMSTDQITVDQAVPAAPGTPNMTAATDLGTLNTDNITSDDTPIFDVTGVDGNTINLSSSVDGSIGSGVVASGTVAITATTLTEGGANIFATQTDPAGNTSGASGNLAITIDVTDPPAPSDPDLTNGTDSGVSNSDNLTNDNTPIFAGTGTNGISVRIISSFDGAVGSVLVGGPGTYSITTSTLSNGLHTITAQAFDVAGNTTDATNTLDVRIDTSGPSVTINKGGAQADPTNTVPVTFTAVFSEAINAASFVNGDLTVTSGTATGESVSTRTSPDSITWTITVNATGQGTIVATIPAGNVLDSAGNSNALSTSTDNSIIYDTTLPVVSAIAPGNNAFRNNTFVGYTLTEANGIASGTVTWTQTGGTADPGSPHVQALVPAELTAGVHALAAITNAPTLVDGSIYTIAFNVTDAAGNNSLTVSSTNVTYDITPPAAPGTPDLTTGTDSGVSSSDDITSDTTPNFTGSGVATTTVIILDGATPVGNQTLGGATYTITTSALTNGVHSITATATDQAGNVSAPTAALSVTIDNVAPTAPSTPDLNAGSDSNINNDNNTNDNTPTFDGTGTNGETVEILAAAVVVGSGLVAGGVYNITTSTLADAVHSITARIVDVAGNIGASGALSVTIDTANPAVPGNPDLTTATDTEGVATGRVGTNSDNITKSVNPTFTGTGINTLDVIIFSDLSGQLSSATVVAGNYSVAVGAIVQGVHSITARQRDIAGNLSVVSGAISVTIDRTPPAISGTPVFSADCAGCTDANRESILISFTENIDLGDGLDAAHNASTETLRDGFIPSTGDISNTNSVFTAATDILRFATTADGQWNGSTTFSYYNTADQPTNAADQHPNYIHDIAGNEMATVVGFGVGDNQAVGLGTGFVFFPNGGSAETIVVRVNEELNLANGAAVTGFTTVPAGIGTAIYSGKGTTNTITLTATGDGVWTDAVTIAYSTATGNVLDLTGLPANELPSFGATQIRLRTVNIVSNNANGFLQRAKPGDTVTVSYTNTGAGPTINAVTIDGMSAIIGGTAPNYTAKLATTASNNTGVMPFLIAFKTASDSTTVTATTNSPTGSIMSFDKTAPSITPVTIASNNADPTRAKPGDIVTLSFTVNELLFGSPVVTIDGDTATLGGAHPNYTAAVTTDGTYTDGALAFNISLQDEVGNTASATAITAGSNVTFDKILPFVSSIAVFGADLNGIGTTNGTTLATVRYTVTFNESVTGLDTADFAMVFSGYGGFGAYPLVSGVETAIAGGPSVYTVTVTSAAGTGIMNLTFVSNGTVLDLTSNVNTASFATGQTYTRTLVEPTNNVTGPFAATATGTSTIDLTWTNAVAGTLPTHLLITATGPDNAEVTPAAFVPADGNTGTAGALPVAENDFSDGNGIAIIDFNLFPGANSYTFSNMRSGKIYNFAIYPITLSPNTTSDNSNYKLTGTPTASATTQTAAAGTLAAGSTAAPATISSLSTAFGSKNFTFIIKDDGPPATEGLDNSKLEFTQLVIRAGSGNTVTKWSDVIAEAELKTVTEATTILTTVIGDSTITFTTSIATNAEGELDDNEQKEYELRIRLKNPLTGPAPQTVDNQRFDFKVNASSFTGNYAVGSSTIEATQTVDSDPLNAFTNNTVDVLATQLNFTTQPVSPVFVLTNVTAVSAAPDLSTVPVVRARDANGNTDLGYTTTLNITNAGGLPMLNLGGGNTLAINAGRANFPVNFQYDDDGTGTLTASRAGITSGNSSLVTVNYDNNNRINAAGGGEPLTISSLVEAGPGTTVFNFNVVDDNSSGGDGSPTRISQIVITQGTGNDILTWTDAIAGATLTDQFSNTIAGTVNTADITFGLIPFTTGALGYIGDNATKTYTLNIWLDSIMGGGLPAIVDNLNLVFDVTESNIMLNSLSSDFTAASAQAQTSGPANNAVEVIATELQFTTNPAASLLVNKDINLQLPVPVVQARDANDNRDLNYNSATVTVTNAGGIPMSNFPGNPSIVAGIVTFANTFQYDDIGNGTLTVASTGPSVVTNAVSTAVNVRVGVSGTITAGAGAEPASFASTVDTDAEKVLAFDFTINDDATGGSTEDDGNPIRISGITITPLTSALPDTISNWNKVIQSAQLSSGGPFISGTISANQIVFSGIVNAATGNLGFVDDGSSKTYTLRIYLRDTLLLPYPITIDNKRFRFEVTQGNIAALTVGSQIVALENENSGAGNNQVTVTATKINFSQLDGSDNFKSPYLASNFPSSGSINSPFDPRLGVEAADVNNNRDLDFVGAISAFSAGNPTILSTINNPSGAFTAGTLKFPSFPVSVVTSFQYTSGANQNGELSMTAGGISGTSPPINITSSFESILTVDPLFTYTADIPYQRHQAVNILNDANSFELIRFRLYDGNGAVNDLDGASTTLTSLTFTLTNPASIRRIALYNDVGGEIAEQAGGTSPITFGGLSIIANDNLTKVFSVRVSFNNTPATITDNQLVQLQVTAAANGGGSQFDNTPPTNIGGLAGGYQAPAGVNVIEVFATKLDFSSNNVTFTQPAPFAGINEPVTTGIVYAQDQFDLRDLDFNFVPTFSTPGPDPAGLDFSFAPPAATLFINGVLDLTGMRYNDQGDGTLLVSANGINSDMNNVVDALTNNSDECIHIDVIHVETAVASTGVITTTNLAGGSVNKVIFGVTFFATYSIPGDPLLNEFTLDFGNNITGVLVNPRVYESTNNSYTPGGETEVVTGLGASITPGPTTLTVTFASGRDLSAGSLTYFLEVDIDPTANGSTPALTPNVVDLGYPDATDGNIVTSEGSAFSSLPSTSLLTFSFAAIFPPVLISSFPASGQLNINPAQPTIDLIFNVPVGTMNGRIYLYDQATDALVATLLAANGLFPADTAGTAIDPLKFTIPGGTLLPDKVYYILIDKGDLTTSIGIRDAAGNLFPGISYSGTLYFKTVNPNPPLLLASPVAQSDPAIVPSSTSVPFTGATIRTTFDQPGTAYFLVKPVGGAVPTSAEIKGLSYGGSVTKYGSFPINQTNPVEQFGSFSVTTPLSPSTAYQVWICAESYSALNGVLTPILTSAPYGGLGSGFAIGGAGPTLSFTSAATSPAGLSCNAPAYSICKNSYQILNLPIVVREGAVGDLNVGAQTIYLVLPAGFEFDVTKNGSVPKYGTITPSATADLQAASFQLDFLGNSILIVNYNVTGNSTLDNFTIAGLRVLATGTASGTITRIGGSGSITSVSFGSIGSFTGPTVDFDNSYSRVALNNPPTNVITTIPDNYSEPGLAPLSVELIPSPPAGDYGASSFSGQGVNINLLSLTAVSLGVPFNITITHTDNNGCISLNPIQYTVYDHNTAIKGLSTEYCADNDNFVPNTFTSPTYGMQTDSIKYNALPAYYLEDLTTTLPQNADITKPFHNPADSANWKALVESASFLIRGASFNPINNPIPGPIPPAKLYYNFAFDLAVLLDAPSYNGAIPDPYSYFRQQTLGTPATPLGNTYYQGGSLGLIEFNALYQSIANAALQIPLRQNVEFFVPAVPIIEVSQPGQIQFDGTGPVGIYPGTPVFCQAGGQITLNGFPAALAGSSVGFFTLRNASSNLIIYANNLQLVVLGQSNNGGNTQLTLSDNLNMAVGGSITVAGSVNGTFLITGTSASNIYTINLAYNVTNTFTSAEVDVPLAGFTDNSNGTATLNPLTLANNYADIRVDYTFKENLSPCQSSASQLIRITPNPVGMIQFASAGGPNSLAGSTAYCVTGPLGPNPVNFNGSASTIAGSNPPSTGVIQTYHWNFGDPNSGPLNDSTITSGIVPHEFGLATSYTVSLNLTSNWGCPSVLVDSVIQVGNIPVVDFTFMGTCVGLDMTFTSTSTVAGSTISQNDWAYGDAFSGSGSPALHTYAAPGTYDVILTSTSARGCFDSDTLQVAQVPFTTPGAGSAFQETFELNDGGWQAIDIDPSDTVSASWGYGLSAIPPKSRISPSVINGTKYWVTAPADTSYNALEKSALYSPCFDLSGLARPMISFNSFNQLEPADGVVLQYSVDNKNIIDPTKNWDVLGTTIGGIASGADWYNTGALPSLPGGAADNPSGFGWTFDADDTVWLESKHALDALGGPPNAVFRFALSSINPDPQKDGFAIDNVRIGNRTRTILLEHFTSTDGGNATLNGILGNENHRIDTFANQAFGTQLVKIFYHTGFTGNDPFNLASPADPSARALFYNVNQLPYTFLDGKRPQQVGNQIFTAWGQSAYDLQTLQLAKADIVVTANSNNSDGSVKVSGTITPIIPLPIGTVLQVAFLEDTILTASLNAAESNMIQTPEDTLSYVLRQMLPSASGTKSTVVMPSGAPVPFGPFSWIPPRLFSGNISVVVFLQNENTREIYQAEVVSGLNAPPTITEIENTPDGDLIKIFPNPADKELNVTLPRAAMRTTPLRLADQVGRITHDTYFNEGQQTKTLSTQELAPGVYILMIDLGNGNMERRKVVITHRE